MLLQGMCTNMSAMCGQISHIYTRT